MESIANTSTSTTTTTTTTPPCCPDFRSKLEARIHAIDSLLCVGIDPHRSELLSSSLLFPNDNEQDQQQKNADLLCDAAFTFSKNLIEATLEYAACYKPNAAFFEALGDAGIHTLKRVVNIIPSNIPILLDVKRGDIGTTAMAYAEACYDHLHVDAVTLSPLMGWDSVQPFVTGTYGSRSWFWGSKMVPYELEFATPLFYFIFSLVSREICS
jgi:uridine monophosphate synthetase